MKQKRTITSTLAVTAIIGTSFVLQAAEPAGAEQTTNATNKLPATSTPNTEPRHQAANGTSETETLEATPSQWSDRELERVIRQRLQRNQAVPAHAVDVSVRNGTATLTGQIESYAAKRVASDAVAATRGVADVINRLQVVNGRRLSDELITSRVNAALSADAATELREIDVRVEGGTVTLSGRVDSPNEKWIAEEIAANTAGVRALRNAIQVSMPNRRTDAELESEVESRIEWDTRLNDNAVEVEVENGLARLSGQVNSAFQKKWIVRMAQQAGIQHVDATGLKVAAVTQEQRQQFAALAGETKASGTAAAAETGREATTLATNRNASEVKSAVERALETNLRLRDDNIEVSVENGLATLTGSVDTIYERMLATQETAGTAGVRRAYNLTLVRPEARPSDEQLVREMLMAIDRDPYLQRSEVNVTATNSKLWLGGRVDSPYEKRRAALLAAKIPGVLAIQNNIRAESNTSPDLVYYSVTPLYSVSPYTWSDAELRQNVEDQMFWSPFVDADEVSVSVEKNAVTLTGMVDSLAESRAAEENAFEAGATEVHNRLVIGDAGLL